MSDDPEPLLPRAWYSATIAEFRSAPVEQILGRLVANSDVDTVAEQRLAWSGQFGLLQPALDGFDGHIFFEFNIPRMGRRIDVVLLIGAAVLVLEFKVGAREFDRSAYVQVWDYALDLKNFHEASHHAKIVPILVATSSPFSRETRPAFAPDGVSTPLTIEPGRLREVIGTCVHAAHGDAIDFNVWSNAAYRPTPTIIEAARTLYAQHSVHAITRNDAGATNLRVTSRRIEELVDYARRAQRKVVCFVTGVPGAGKTLVGLNVATRRRDRSSETHAVFLSGNGPLVAVLREALTRDEQARLKRRGEISTKSRVAAPVKAFIQNVHHFRDEALRSAGPPVDHVVIFDEAQRAWNAAKTASFMRQKKNQPNFTMSEPAFLISYLDRHADWAVIICLVGGGQEIHTGEAGISEWLDAAAREFPGWELHISDQLTDSEYAAGRALELVRNRPGAQLEPNLHLAASLRSFRAEHVSRFVKALLDCEVAKARNAFASISDRYPMFLTRDLDRAKSWLRSCTRGSERCGLVASSKAMRLKPYAIDIRAAIDPVQWFLQDSEDTRSSQYLEDCATEFQVQGLEVDWACVNWDGDFRRAGSSWSFHDFRGKRWEHVKSAERQAYVRNAYRVLLTRARQGMVIFIPRGDPADPTRPPAYYDPTYAYLADLGIPVLP